MRENYPFHNLYWQEFEDLVIDICQVILGLGATKFEDGMDGGRDSTFKGTANSFPSENDPWSGNFVIQAKHTSDPTNSCSDTDFSSESSSSQVSKEIERLKKICKSGPLENYIMFTNRKTTGVYYPKFIKRVLNETCVNNVELVGREHLNKMLASLPHIVAKHKLEENAYPIRFYEKDIKQVILIFDQNISDISKKASKSDKKYIHLDKEGKGNKNDLNELGKEYFEFMKHNSLSYFNSISEFLKDPKNRDYKRKYSNTVEDLKAEILLNRDDYYSFEKLIEDLVQYIYDKCGDDLGNSRNLIRIFIHFMYFECDIGKSN